MFTSYGTYYSQAATSQAQSDASSAQTSAREAKTETELLRHDVDRLLLITEALWNFLKTEHGFTDEQLINTVKEIDLRDGRLDGTGGTTSILARVEKKLERFDRDKIDGSILSRERVSAHGKQLWRLSLELRKEVPGLPKLRADVILSGVLVCEAVMEEFGFQELRISTRGLRFAAMMDP